MLRAFSYTGAQPTFTWATKPSSAANGSIIFVSDVGENGTLFQYSTATTRWRALSGTATLKSLGNATSNIANSETIVLQTQIPAGAWQTNDVVRLAGLAISKSGTTDALALTVRVGTAGTTADTAITGLSAAQVLAASQQSGGFDYDIKLVSATSAQKVAANGATTAPFSGGVAAAVAAATTITDASANALYVSIGIASSGATDTVAMQAGRIQLITP